MWRLLAQDQQAFQQDAATLPVIVAVVVLMVLCVVLHMEGLRTVLWWVRRKQRGMRIAISGAMFALLVLHLIEIGIYAMGSAILNAIYGSRVGVLAGNYDGSLMDDIYFSFAVYTTVGFGDITPEGPLRLLAGSEALVGLVLITWSASFTFLIMQYTWSRDPKALPTN